MSNVLTIEVFATVNPHNYDNSSSEVFWKASDCYDCVVGSYGYSTIEEFKESYPTVEDLVRNVIGLDTFDGTAFIDIDGKVVLDACSCIEVNNYNDGEVYRLLDDGEVVIEKL